LLELEVPHRIEIFNLGKAETFRIDLANGRKILVDYANVGDSGNPDDRRCDLPKHLRRDLDAADRKSYDVVMFTHLDDDHVRGACDFFWLDHAECYKTEDRVRIQELWVPAAAVVEEGSKDDARVIRQEARHRLRAGKGIRVFSAPDSLRDWFETEKLDLDHYKRRGLVIDAGSLVPGFDLQKDGVEFFVHSPFATVQNNGSVLERNRDSIVMQATFQIAEELTRMLITADVAYDVLDEIVRMTKLHGNERRLLWDIHDLSHHCSYKAIGPEKGNEITEPSEGVAWLFEQGQPNAILVSSSWEIPTTDTDQPPHRQAAAYYTAEAARLKGEFLVTMEQPTISKPEPIVILISARKAKVSKLNPSGGIVAVSAPAHRVG
jgi:hypothetical protein